VLSAAPPLLPTGALVDRDSIRLVLTDVLYEVATGLDGGGSENLFATTDPNIDFGALGVRAGDRIVITDLDSEETVIETILTVGGIGAGAALASNQLTVLNEFDEDLLTPESTGEWVWRIEKAVDSAYIDGADAGLAGTGNTITLRGGLSLDLDPDGSGVSSSYLVNSADVHIEYRALRRDLTSLDTVSSQAEITSKIGPIDERNPLGLALYIALSNTNTEIQFVGIDGDDLNGVTDRQQAYLAALETLENSDEPYAIALLSTDLSTIAAYVASVEALAQPSTSIFRIVLGGLAELPLVRTIADISDDGSAEQVSTDTVTAFSTTTGNFETNGVVEDDRLFIVTGTSGESFDVASVVSENTLLLKTAGTAGNATRKFFVLAANGDTYGVPLVSHGSGIRVSKSGGVDRVHVTNVRTLASERVGTVIMLTDSDDAISYNLVTAVTPAVSASLLLSGTGITVTALAIGRTAMEDESGEILIDIADTGTLEIDFDDSALPYRLTINVDSGVTEDADITAAINAHEVASLYVVASGGAEAATTIGTGTDNSLENGEFAFYTVVGPAALPASEEDDWSGEVRLARFSIPAGESATFRKPFRRFYDAAAAFTTGDYAVQVGDLIQIPYDDEDTTYEGRLWSGVVASVVSGQRLLIADGSDALLATPLTTSASQDLATYRVVRTLTASGRTTELQAMTEALDSAAAVMVLPASVSVSGVVNARTGAASRQNGSFLAAAVLGMIAGSAPHQGFTNRSLAGISQVYGVDAFTRAQVNTLADSGWMVWAQRTRASAPICVHQSTTWQSAELIYRELSMIRAYHFCARAVKDAVVDFLGKYNVTADTLSLVKTVVRATLAQLQSGRLPQIGSVLQDASVSRVIQNSSRPDVIEIYIDWGFPAPLNQIDVYTRG